MLSIEKLYRINKNNEDLIQLLSPEITASNQELFYKKSGDQNKFNKELRNKGIDLINGEKYPELENSLTNIRQEIIILLKNNSDIKRPRLDLDMAKIFHKNLNLPKMATIDYEFWKYITLFYFIEVVKWRWEKDPEKPENWNTNAKAICGRSLGLTLNKKKYDEDKTISYTIRNQRIDCYRYWWIGNKLFDKTKGYYYLDKISEKFKNEDASLQDFLNHLEGNKLLSENDRVSKIMAESILLSHKKFSETEMRNSFNRYNAFSNRLFMEAEEKMIKKEICLIDV
ncbi:MAG: hypothetical protein IPJ02_15610 [Chitinophagaceae bacterium]|nr:hypothetical protein [Chitinophagaceae bacterium]